MEGLRRASALLFLTLRGQFSLLTFLMLFQAYAIRVVMSVAIIPIAKEFAYSDTASGLILSSFFIGYMVLQVPAGTLGAWYGGRRIFTAGILLPSLLTALTPLAAGSLPGLVALRIVTGLCEGVCYPSLHALMGQWVPAGERSMLLGVMWSGAFVGSAATLPVAGALCASLGWRSAFYIYAAFGVGVSLLFWLYSADSPETHPRISQEEAAYIVAHRVEYEGEGAGGGGAASVGAGGEEGAAAQLLQASDAPPPRKQLAALGEAAPVPVLRILLCPPALAGFAAHFGHNWTFYLLLTWLPKYMKARLGLDLEASTGLAVLPYLACFLGSTLGGSLADWLISRGVRVLTVRKGIFVVGELVPALALIAAGFTTDVATAVALLTLAVGVSGISQTSFAVTPLDIAPHLGGVLMGMQNTLATIPGIVAPLVAGAMVQGSEDAAHWQQVFYLAGGVAAGGVAVYAALADDELAPSLQPGYSGPWVCGVGRRGRGAGAGEGEGEEGVQLQSL
jgi:MFS family permease